MEKHPSPKPVALPPETQAVIEKYSGGVPLSDADIVEIKTSLFHLGRAIARYYHLDSSGRM